MKKTSILLGTALALMCGSALADTRTSSFGASANVARSCKIMSASNASFGEYDSTSLHASSPIDTESQVSIVCTTGSSGVQIHFDGGANRVSGSPNSDPGRRMKAGSNYLNYQIYYNPQRATILRTDSYYSMLNFTSMDPVAWTVYLRLFPGQSVPAGTYTDTLNVSVIF